ncbi:MAG: type II secretion system protein [Candidatus Saccharimonadaceae bacterium]
MTHTTRPIVQRGFTIVELLVVISVIAILTAITIVSYTAVTDHAKNETVKTDAQAIAAQLNKYKADKGSYPTDLSTLSSNPGTSSTFQYSYDATAGSYCVTASVNGASAYIKSGSSLTKEGGCPGHGIDGDDPVTNYAYNPGAEVDAGWLSNNPATYPRVVDTSVKHSGSRSIKAAPTGTNTALLSLYAAGAPTGNGNVPVSVEAGTYTHAVYFRADVAHRGGLGIAWRVAGVWSTAIYSATVTGTAGQWTRVSQTFSIPQNVEFLRSIVSVSATSSQPAGTPGWADDYSLEKGTVATGYGDGFSQNWLWSGAVNNSPSYGPKI